MTQTAQAMSLLPFLSPAKSKIYIQIPQQQPRNPDSSFPFFVLNDADAFSRLVPAAFMTPGGEKLKNIFLLLQNDNEISIPDKKLLDNAKTGELWQEISRTYNPAEQPLNLTGETTSAPDRPQLFAARLFFRQKDIFFHPLCPQCGGRLTQCLDDEILQASGLPPFSTSLKRYLYCPACYASARSGQFFVRDHDNNAPDFVHDCGALIKLMGQMVAENKAPADLPCGKCPEAQECFGAKEMACKRIAPLSFYNFYLLASGELPLSALDFLAMTAAELLLTGARPEPGTRAPQQPLPAQQPAENQSQDNQAIYAILTAVRAEWGKEETSPDNEAEIPAAPAPPVPEENPDDDMDKTMIINPADIAADSAPAAEPEDDLDKTMIINTADIFSDSAPAAAGPPPAPAPEPEDEMDKTMIINQAELFPEQKETGNNTPAAEELIPEEEMDAEKTMILSADEIARLMNKRRDG